MNKDFIVAKSTGYVCNTLSWYYISNVNGMYVSLSFPVCYRLWLFIHRYLSLNIKKKISNNMVIGGVSASFTGFDNVGRSES